jgi:hypothetical protein
MIGLAAVPMPLPARNATWSRENGSSPNAET